MKAKSLVTVIYYSTVNYMSNFAHTAHHARRIVIKGSYPILFNFGGEVYNGNLSEVDTRYW